MLPLPSHSLFGGWFAASVNSLRLLGLSVIYLTETRCCLCSHFMRRHLQREDRRLGAPHPSPRRTVSLAASRPALRISAVRAPRRCVYRQWSPRLPRAPLGRGKVLFALTCSCRASAFHKPPVRCSPYERVRSARDRHGEENVSSSAGTPAKGAACTRPVVLQGPVYRHVAFSVVCGLELCPPTRLS